MRNEQRADHRLRVIFLDHIARLSGGEIAMLRLLPALAADVDIHVVLGEDGPLVARLRAAGVSAEVMPLAPRLRDVRKERVRVGGLDPVAMLSLPPYVLRLRRRLRELEADLVHTNSLKAAFYGGAAARLAHIPAVWHVRDRIAADYLPRSAVFLVRAASRVLPTAIVANSQTTLDTLPASVGSRVLYNPVVVPDAVEAPPTDTHVSDSGPMVGVVGRLAPWKGQDVFLEAFAEAFVGTGVRGRIIGSAMFGEDAFAASLERQAERLGIAGQIEFRGFRDDVWAELSELDVLVHCSVSPEPFGQVVLEGMASGVPVVAAAAGGPAELITNGVNGILTAPGDQRALAAALRTLHDDPGLRARLGNAGRERSREFTPERTAEQLLAVYREIIPRRS
jgi:glycosyltransferase involved in cell wall biosynthesis